jgi:hypothetical protein
MTEENAPTTRFELDGFGSELLRPSDEGYDDARRVFNGMIDRRPALIARCAKAADVVAAVNLAREENLPLSIYGGGHGVTGSAVVDAGICIDLRGMKGVTSTQRRAQSVLREGSPGASSTRPPRSTGWQSPAGG